MKNFQKIIKYSALVFAIVLIIGIFRVAVGGLLFVGGFFFDTNQKAEALVERDINFDFEDYDNLDIHTKISRLTVKTGDKFSVVTNNKDLTIETQRNSIIITDNHREGFFYRNRDLELIVVLPTDRALDAVSIETGAGKVSIEELYCKNARINLGAGEVTIGRIDVTNEIKLSGGVGELTVHDGKLNNLDADLGVGTFNATLSLTGRNKIDAGVGEVGLNLLDSYKNYTFNVDKGLGDIKLDRNSIQSGVYGNGIHTVDISGGVGEITISTED
ncbi:TPA: DUF4097 domain-containing protein [Candidatus Dojkabacteria bacterium]|uniref:DUF4097 domain-containing protein n=1 Tax=Candidatus Dojkabacteria bacterium TaxID=2099670 RepID=A0A832R8T6_9BACT|nr:DUF4097 domain-containing protein [Candidatus Dojkabacteria bacterium]